VSSLKQDAAADTLLSLADAAIFWWVGKRPLSWSVAQHIENPTINCPSSYEKELAMKVSRWAKIQQDRG
jgi:hypothetical protein